MGSELFLRRQATNTMDTSSKLDDFVATQAAVYDEVVQELTFGRKQSHWMWFVFPQLAGLGSSHMARRFALESLAAAREYLAHPVLGPRLLECTRILLAAPHDDISGILGYPDDLKFRSCMTLFAAAAPDEPVFNDALTKFFRGEPDPRTIDLL
jgi:uncharacterized protein (DUF1810 family)